MKKSISQNIIHLFLEDLLKVIKSNIEGIDVFVSLYAGNDEKIILYSQGFANNIEILAKIIIEFLKENPEFCHKKCNSRIKNICKVAMEETENYFKEANKAALLINPKEEDGNN